MLSWECRWCFCIGAVRETREEIGVEITAEDLQYVTMRPFNRNRFAWVYAVDWTGRPEEFHFDDKEVSEVRWVPFKDTTEFREKFAKKPLKKDALTFAMLEEWFEARGLVEKEQKQLPNYAFIDGNNLYLGAKNQGIRLDYRKLRLYLKNKLGVERALLFVGNDKSRMWLYDMLRKSGFELVFKPAVFYTDRGGNRMMKGNVDAELVLHSAAVEYPNYDKAVVMTGDGDFACLMEYLAKNGKLLQIIAPTGNYSLLLRKYKGCISLLERIAKHVERRDENR